MFDMRNNIFYWTTGVQGVYDRTRFKRANNIYCPIGAVRYASTLGGALKSGERLITTSIFKDTTAPYPENWDLHLVDTSYGVAHGLATPGFTRDFDGNLIGAAPSIGLYQQTSTTPACTFTYGQWTACANSIQTRSFTSAPAVCTGAPPIDSVQRACTNPAVITSFYYSASNKRIYIKCNVPGVMVITSVNGNISRNVSYTANGYFINVSALPTGTYFAATYGRGITFIR
jgi:hypothetical protein